MTYELGYIRYDDDINGFKEAAQKGVPKQHPRYHYDVNYSQQAAFKIGLDKKITPDKFIQFLDDTLDRKSLRGWCNNVKYIEYWKISIEFIMAKDRTAIDTIRGYYYQFDLYALRILESSG